MFTSNMNCHQKVDILISPRLRTQALDAPIVNRTVQNPTKGRLRDNPTLYSAMRKCESLEDDANCFYGRDGNSVWTRCIRFLSTHPEGSCFEIAPALLLAEASVNSETVQRERSRELNHSCQLSSLRATSQTSGLRKNSFGGTFEAVQRLTVQFNSKAGSTGQRYYAVHHLNFVSDQFFA